MSRLIIIIHNKDYSEMHGILKLNNFGNGGVYNCIGVTENEYGYYNKIQEPDIVLINDGTIDDAIKKYIINHIERNDIVSIYTCFHKSSNKDDRDNQERVVKEVGKNRNLFTREFSHKASDSFYRSVVIDLLGYVVCDKNKSTSNYQMKLNAIINQFGNDSLLEARIHLWKLLTLLGVKIKRGQINANDYKSNIDAIKNNEIIKNQSDVIKFLEDFGSIEKFHEKMRTPGNDKQQKMEAPEFYRQLFSEPEA